MVLCQGAYVYKVTSPQSSRWRLPAPGQPRTRRGVYLPSAKRVPRRLEAAACESGCEPDLPQPTWFTETDQRIEPLRQLLHRKITARTKVSGLSDQAIDRSWSGTVGRSVGRVAIASSSSDAGTGTIDLEDRPIHSAELCLRIASRFWQSASYSRSSAHHCCCWPRRLPAGIALRTPFRLSLWVLAGIVLGIAQTGMDHWGQSLGLLAPSWRTLLSAVVATVATLAAWPIVQDIQKRAGRKTTFENDAFREITATSVWFRIFLVATAAVTEEILYRGYAIGVGEQILGNRSAAVAISVTIFVGAHFRWGISHMLSVVWAAIVLSTLFLTTRDLAACVTAHGAIDFMGLVMAPAAMARRGRPGGSTD